MTQLGERLNRFAQIEQHERGAAVLAFLCYFTLFVSYYILRPVRDTFATVFGVNELQLLFTGTFVGSLLASPLYAALASRLALKRLLPGVFWFWLINILAFDAALGFAPHSSLVAAAYFIWFSVFNLFMISVFWSLMADLFSPAQASRLFPFIASGGSLGAIGGPLITRLGVRALGLAGLLVIAAGGFLLVIALVHLLMREKGALRRRGEGQLSTLEHALPGNPFEGFGETMRSAYTRNQASFFFLMTFVNTIAYFFQTEIIARSTSLIAGRAVAVADIALWTNILAAIVLLGGVGRFIRRFGVIAALVANPVIMVVAFVVIALAPTLVMVQALQVVRSVSQYAIARPSREICFTVVEQSSRYKAKNVIDTVVYRFGDVVSAWFQTAMRTAGLHIAGAAVAGVGVSFLWGGVALALGRRYESRRIELKREADLRALAPEAAPGTAARQPQG
ncbi:MAG TPA: MFS transporter [Steroidobacteraceae bacterium]|nr:MFS transporter [Steroidobacteraceae bacterium]